MNRAEAIEAMRPWVRVTARRDIMRAARRSFDREVFANTGSSVELRHLREWAGNPEVEIRREDGAVLEGTLADVFGERNGA
jgi:hypothetical protein